MSYRGRCAGKRRRGGTPRLDAERERLEGIKAAVRSWWGAYEHVREGRPVGTLFGVDRSPDPVRLAGMRVGKVDWTAIWERLVERGYVL